MVQFGKTDHNTTNSAVTNSKTIEGTRTTTTQNNKAYSLTEGNRDTKYNILDQSNHIQIHKSTDMSLLLATVAINVAVPLITGLIQLAINKWNDEIPDTMMIQAEQEYDLLVGKVQKFVEDTGGEIMFDISRPIELSAKSFLVVQQFFYQYSESILLDATKRIFLGIIDNDRLKIKDGETLMHSTAHSLQTSLESQSKYSFNDSKTSFKFEQAISCLERMTPSNQMPHDYEIIVPSPRIVIHMNVDDEDLSMISTRFDTVYEIESTKVHGSNFVKLSPKKRSISVLDLSKIYQLDISKMSIAQFYGHVETFKYIREDSNFSQEAVMSLYLGHSLTVLREVIVECKKLMIMVMLKTNVSDSVVNLYRRCEHGPWITLGLSMTSFTDFTGMFKDVTNQGILNLDKDFKTMHAILQVCSLKESLFPNMKTQNYDVIDRYVQESSNLYSPLTPVLRPSAPPRSDRRSSYISSSSEESGSVGTLYPKIRDGRSRFVGTSSVNRLRSQSSKPKKYDRTSSRAPADDNVLEKAKPTCLYTLIKDTVGDKMTIGSDESDISVVDPIKILEPVKKIMKEYQNPIRVVINKHGYSHVSTWLSYERCGRSEAQMLPHVNKLLKDSKTDFAIENGNIYLSTTSFLTMLMFTTRDYMGEDIQDKVTNPIMFLSTIEVQDLLHRSGRLIGSRSKSIKTLNNKTDSQNDCLRSVIKIAFNYEIGQDIRSIENIDSNILMCFKRLVMCEREIANICVRSYRYGYDDLRNHIEIDDEANRMEDLYKSKRDCEIKVMRFSDLFLSPSHLIYRETKYYSSIVSTVNYEKYAKCLEFDLKIVIKVKEDYKLQADVNPEFASWLLSRMICDVTRLRLNTWKDVVFEYGFLKFDTFDSDIRGPITIMLAVIDKYNKFRNDNDLSISSLTSKIFKSKTIKNESILCLNMNIIDSSGSNRRVFDCIEFCDISKSTIASGVKTFVDDIGITPTCSRICTRKIPMLIKHGLSALTVSKELRDTGYIHVFN